MSRREFLGRTSVVAMGTVAATGFLGTTVAGADPGPDSRSGNGRAPGIGLAVPIPYGNDFLGDGSLFHVEAPGFPGFGEDPSTVYNFAGTSAIGFIDGTVVRRNRRTSEEVTLPFLASDMRFMKGDFEGRDGRVRHATFGFVWIDVFDPSSGAQLHDFNPGIRNNGLFWTTVVPDHSVNVDHNNGRAEFSLSDTHMPDFHDFTNALTGDGTTTPGIVSFRVTWETSGPPDLFDDPTRPLWRRAAPAIARMEWTGRSGQFEFHSHPITTSSSEANGALLGQERNGSQYWATPNR